MDLRETIRIAGRSLRSHRLRSTLTIIGVVIGIGAVIAFASFGASVEASVITAFEDTSANEIFVSPGGSDDNGPGFGTPDTATSGVFTDSDIAQLRAIDGVIDVIPRGIIFLGPVTDGDTTVRNGVTVATSETAFTQDQLVQGRTFRPNASEVVINEVARDRFQNLSVGATLTFEAQGRNETYNLTVVGITTGAQGELGAQFGGGTPRFYLPAQPPYYTQTVMPPGQAFQERAFPQLTVTAEAGKVDRVQRDVATFLRTESDAISLDGVNEITVQSSQDIIQSIQSVISNITRFVTGIGVLALIVGAFGIANIMLVSVTERTKEIGIMKAIGATNREIMGLFLAESVILGSLGAVLGIPVGLGTGYIATQYADVGFTTPINWVLLAVGIGIAIGIIAGLYPAWRAARIDPIDALRYE